MLLRDPTIKGDATAAAAAVDASGPSSGRSNASLASGVSGVSVPRKRKAGKAHGRASLYQHANDGKFEGEAYMVCGQHKCLKFYWKDAPRFVGLPRRSAKNKDYLCLPHHLLATGEDASEHQDEENHMSGVLKCFNKVCTKQAYHVHSLCAAHAATKLADGQKHK